MFRTTNYSAHIESTITESAETVSTETESLTLSTATLSESFEGNTSCVLLPHDVIESAANATKAKIIFFIIV